MIKHIGESTNASVTYAGFSERNLEEVSQGSIVVFGVIIFNRNQNKD